MNKIIFVNPPIRMEEVYGKLASAAGVDPPLGLCHLAAVTRERGYETKILDAHTINFGMKKSLNFILNENPNYVGITAVTITITKAAQLAKMIKEANKNIKIIIGGPHITSIPKKTMELFKEFDIGVIGEGEETIIELLEHLDKKKNLKKVKGIVYREKNKIILNDRREFIEDLDKLPLPAWDLLPNLVKNYRPSAYSYNKLPSSILITSRGCSGQCTFCDRGVFGNKYRTFSAEYVIKMIKYLHYNYGIKDILFDDDTFTSFRDRLIELCDLLKKEKLNISWSCNSRVNFVNKDILKIMKEAGCWQISYGIESGNQEVLNSLKKGITLEQVRKAIKLTKEAGIKTKGFFMVGLPTDTKETIEQTIKFMKELPLDFVEVLLFTPFPGSEAYETAKQIGWFDDNWDKMSEYECVYTPENISIEKLKNYQKEAFRKFYLRPKVILSQLSMIKNPSQILRAFKGGMGLLKLLISRE